MPHYFLMMSFLPIGLQKCAMFLENNLDYVSCKGMALGFTFKDGHIFCKEMCELADCKMIPLPLERVIQHMSNYQMVTLWALMRRNVFLKTLSAMADGPRFRSAAIGEMQTSIVASYMGKCHVIDSLMWLRSLRTKTFGGKMVASRLRSGYMNPLIFLA